MGFNPSIQPMAYQSEPNRLFNAAKHLSYSVFVIKPLRVFRCQRGGAPLYAEIISLAHIVVRVLINAYLPSSRSASAILSSRPLKSIVILLPSEVYVHLK